MGRLVLSFNTALAAPIGTGYEGIGAGMSYYHFDAPLLVGRFAFYLDLLHRLFEGEVCLQLCGTPYGLFTKGAMAGSWVLLHPANTRFAEHVPAEKGKIIGSSIKVSLKHKENMDFDCSEFSQKRIKGIHKSQSEDAKEKKKTTGNAGKCDQLVNRSFSVT